MAKPRILKVVNYREEDMGNLKQLEDILKRNGKEYTEWVREQGEAYIKAHGEGNDQYTLDKDVKAYPTPWTKEPFSLHDMTEAELAEMADFLRFHSKEVEYERKGRAPAPQPFSYPNAVCPACGKKISNPYNKREADQLDMHYYNHPECKPKGFKPEPVASGLEGANPMSGAIAD